MKYFVCASLLLCSLSSSAVDEYNKKHAHTYAKRNKVAIGVFCGLFTSFLLCALKDEYHKSIDKVVHDASSVFTTQYTRDTFTQKITGITLKYATVAGLFCTTLCAIGVRACGLRFVVDDKQNEKDV